jgi:hypothetical protein
VKSSLGKSDTGPTPRSGQLAIGVEQTGRAIRRQRNVGDRAEEVFTY